MSECSCCIDGRGFFARPCPKCGARKGLSPSLKPPLSAADLRELEAARRRQAAVVTSLETLREERPNDWSEHRNAARRVG